jgi:hypothetical protein
MLLALGSSSGSDPYTNPFTLGASNSYTLEFAKGRMSQRFFGVQARQISNSYDGNKMQLNIEITALGQFSVAEISTATGTAPTTITLKTNYDQDPTKGLVVNDIMTAYDVSEGTYINFVVDALPSDTTIECSEDVSALDAGDIIFLRPQTPTYSLSVPFTLGATEYRFGATASAALSASQLQVEPDASWTVSHEMLPAEGALRTGSLDPAALPRGVGDVSVNLSRFFDNADDMNRHLTATKRALVIRHFAYTTGGLTYELRVTVNNYKQTTANKPLEVGGIIMDQQELKAQYDSSDAQMFDVKVLSGVEMN